MRNSICHHCNCGELARIKRSRWMRVFNTSKHYVCTFCRARFLYFTPNTHLVLRRGRIFPNHLPNALFQYMVLGMPGERRKS